MVAFNDPKTVTLTVGQWAMVTGALLHDCAVLRTIETPYSQDRADSIGDLAALIAQQYRAKSGLGR
jgi:hypothetical protein